MLILNHQHAFYSKYVQSSRMKCKSYFNVNKNQRLLCLLTSVIYFIIDALSMSQILLSLANSFTEHYLLNLYHSFSKIEAQKS